MGFAGLQRIVLMAAGVALAASAASAQTVDERYPHLSPAAKPAAAAPARMQAASEAPSPVVVQAATVSHRRSVDPVPYPRPAPKRANAAASVVVAEAGSSSVPKASAPIGQYAYAGPSAAVTAAFSSLEEARQPDEQASWPLRGAAPVPMPPVRPQPKDQARVPALDTADIAVMVENTAVAHDVPLELAHAVVRVESNYNPRATGHDGTVGLMQIKPSTARGLGFSGSARELYNPKTNLEWGIRYLARARKLAKGNVCRTVMKYQGGHGAERMTNASAVYCGKVKTIIARTR
jgi:soluble lytic murein transglycosylase-like protein